MNEINEQIDVILENQTIDVIQIKNSIRTILVKQKQSQKIQFSSTKLLSFYVNDILDFAQINAGRFRRDCHNMDIKQTIEEVMLIMQNKAEQQGV